MAPKRTVTVDSRGGGGASGSRDGSGIGGDSSGRVRSRSRSPVHQEQRGGELSVEDLQRLVTDSITAQMPRMIVETSKVVRESILSDREDSSKLMSQEMKLLKQRQEDLSVLSKAASLKSEGN